MAFESLPGVKISDPNTKQAYIVSDYFSFYEDAEARPVIYSWADFKSIAETKDAFILTGEDAEFSIPKSLMRDPVTLIRVRAIIEGAIAANPGIEYKYGRRILPPKSLCRSCEIPADAYVATGAYKEKEINNSNVILRNPVFDKVLWVSAAAATVIAFAVQFFYFGRTTDILQLLMYFVISVFAGGATGMTVYLFCAYGAKTLYGKILKEDPALLEEITFVVCDKGFMAAETEVYDFSDIIQWQQVAYFMETTHVYIIFNENKAVFWLPKRLFPKEMHEELGNFIADRLMQK